MREAGTVILPPSQLALDATDEIVLSANGRDWQLRVSEIDDAGARTLSVVATDPSVYDPIVGPSRAPDAVQTLAQSGRALVTFLDLPLLSDTQIPWAPFAAAFASPWPGAVLIYRSASDANYALDTTLTRAAAIGVTTTEFFPGPAWRWDRVNTLGVRLFNGALASQDDLSVLNGANALAVETGENEWEIVQFANATLTGSNSWTLDTLLRGQAGSENEMGAPLAAGARIVVLDASTTAQLGLSQSQYKLPFNYLWGPRGKPISDPAFQAAPEQFAGVGLRPYAPCQLRAVYADNGSDLDLSWVRRDRAPSADSWDQVEIPMSETSESYDLEILDAAGAVKRSFASLPSPNAVYSAAGIAADFPSGLPRPFCFRVYQLSSVFGRGIGKTAAIALA